MYVDAVSYVPILYNFLRILQQVYALKNSYLIDSFRNTSKSCCFLHIIDNGINAKNFNLKCLNEFEGLTPGGKQTLLRLFGEYSL